MKINMHEFLLLDRHAIILFYCELVKIADYEGEYTAE